MSKVVKTVSKNPPPKLAAPKRKGGKYQMPDPLPCGEILTDLAKKQWKLGSSIGKGGFGEIYSATDVASGKNAYVIKIEPKENGPLFVEMHFFMKVCKSDDINKWMSNKNLKFLGLPRFTGNGSHQHNGKPYRFVVMEKYGKNLDDMLKENKNVLSGTRIFQIALQIIDALEYIHSKGYVHADIKGANLLLGLKNEDDKVHIVDFGLASKYPEDFKTDPKCAHNGTIEFTSRDAHVGATTRRGDLEILAYNMLRWFTGKLPWEKKLSDCSYVQQQKLHYMKDIPALMNECFGSKPVPEALQKYFDYVSNMPPTAKPDYDLCRQLFQEGMKTKVIATKKPKVVSPQPKSNPVNHEDTSNVNDDHKAEGKRKNLTKARMQRQANAKVVEPPVPKRTNKQRNCKVGNGYYAETDSFSEDESFKVKTSVTSGKNKVATSPQKTIRINTSENRKVSNGNKDDDGASIKKMATNLKCSESVQTELSSEEDIFSPTRPTRTVKKMDYSAMGFVPESDSSEENVSAEEDDKNYNPVSKTKEKKPLKRNSGEKGKRSPKKKRC